MVRTTSAKIYFLKRDASYSFQHIYMSTFCRRYCETLSMLELFCRCYFETLSMLELFCREDRAGDNVQVCISELSTTIPKIAHSYYVYYPPYLPPPPPPPREKKNAPSSFIPPFPSGGSLKLISPLGFRHAAHADGTHGSRDRADTQSTTAREG